MSALSDYRERGGLAGFAKEVLREQLQRAAEAPDHILAGVADALAEGDSVKAVECLLRALADLPDGHHPLGVVKLVFLTLPSIQAATKEAEDMLITGTELPDSLPSRLVAWAGMGAFVRERNSKAAKKPRKGKPGRTKLIEAMVSPKQNGQSLKEFLQSAEAGSIENLSVNLDIFTFDDSDHDPIEYEANYPSLMKCWEEAGKRQKSKIRN
jgi:hypothetical protein